MTAILEHGLSALNISDTANGGHAQMSASSALAGMEDVLSVLREVISWPVLYAKEATALGIRWPTGVLLHGPPGVGKSAAVAAVASECNAILQTITPAMIFGSYVGESERRLREVFAEAEQTSKDSGQTVVIFLDEIDSLCPRRDGGQQHEARIVGQLLTLLDGAASSSSSCRQQQQRHRVVIVAATNRPNAIDPALRRPGRLEREVAVSVPSPQARVSILTTLAREIPLADDVDLVAIAGQCHGFTGADLVALCREAAMQTILKLANSSTSSTAASTTLIIPVSSADFEIAKSKVGASLARGVAKEFPPADYNDIGGCDEAKRKLKQAVEWPMTRSEAFKRLGLNAPRGVLLHGPPGCAKTTLARAAATASGATFIPLVGSQLYSMYVGEGEAILREAFKRARLATPAIIFIDELDAVVGKRAAGTGEAKDNDASARLLSTFLTEMDGLEHATGVVVLGTTNRVQALDPALLRPGRFDHIVFVPPPDAAGRLAALKVHTRKMPLAADVDLQALAADEVTDLYTGAELAGVCREAALCAVREAGPSGLMDVNEVAARHFKAAVQGMKPALTRQSLKEYQDSWA